MNRQQQDRQILHVLKEHDTLASVAMTYNVPIAELKTLNRLRNSEIWSLKTLTIPLRNEQREVLEATQPSEPENKIENAENLANQRAMICCAIRRLLPKIPEVVILACVDHCVTFKKSLNVCEWVSQVTTAVSTTAQHRSLDPRECLAYLEMNDFDILKASEALRCDYAWSDQKIAAAPHQKVRPLPPATIETDMTSMGSDDVQGLCVAETELTITQRKRKII